MIKIIAIVMLATTISCGSQDAAPSDVKENTEKTTSTSSQIDLSPCDLVDEATIITLFSIPSDAITEIENKVLTYPTCMYKWETVQYAKTKMIANQEATINYPTEMTIVLVKNATPKMFETSTKVYKDGVMANGIGEMAIWGDSMSQITFLAKGYMIHLCVKKSSDENENKALAMKIAPLIIEKL